MEKESDFEKEFVRGLGLDPEDVLTRNAPAELHRIYAKNQEREDDQIRALSRAFMDNLKKELSKQPRIGQGIPVSLPVTARVVRPPGLTRSPVRRK
jgi:plasmid stabilization system protein ParE